MKVAIDISSLKSGHSVRGIGSYTKNLTEEFKLNDFGLKFEFFQNPSSPPPADLIHSPYFDLFFHTLPIRKKASRVVTIHDVIPLVFPKYFPVGVKGRINFFFQKQALKKADVIICDSKTSKNDITEKLSIPEKKIHVVYLAPSKSFRQVKDKKILNNVSKKYKLPKKFTLYVGDVNWNKNIKNLIKAIKLSALPIVMVGQALADHDLYQTEEINKEINKLDLKNEIVRPGYVPENDLIAIYNLANVTLLPSFYEGFGLPLLESMACGTPVICSNLASLSEIAGSAAIFCDPNDPKDIAQKIKSTTQLSSIKREELSQKSQKQASKFTWSKVASQTSSIYKSLA